MKVVTVNKTEKSNCYDVLINTFFDMDSKEATIVKMGTVVFPPGARVPTKGSGVHAEHEYAYVMSGSILTMSGGEKYRLTKGQASLIPAGEEHWAWNDGTEKCEIIWILSKK